MLHIYPSRTFLFLAKFHIFSRSEKSWGGQKIVKFRLKSRCRPKKCLVFIFLFWMHIYTSRQNFFASTKISYLQPLRKIMGGTKNVNFRLKNRRRTKKLLILDFFILMHIYLSRRKFFVSTKISYLQPFREIMGGPE